MGAWGHGSFENDDALDFVGELTAASALGDIESALNAVGPGLTDAEGPEAPEASLALAAAELVAAALGHPSEDIPEEAGAAVAALEAHAPSFRDRAQSAAAAVLQRSELRELWDEGEEGDDWAAGVQDLLTRLQAP